MVTREDAQKVVDDHVANDSLKKHLLAVETCMRAFARKEGEDEEEWGIAGLVHDFDWEVCPTPDSHPTFGADILRERGFPEEIVRAVLSHGNHTGIPRETLMEKALFACDELSGFVTAVALVRPTKSLSDTKPRSVKKKMKDKAFAKSVSREDMLMGAEELGVSFDEHIVFVIDALKPVASELGLNPWALDTKEAGQARIGRRAYTMAEGGKECPSTELARVSRLPFGCEGTGRPPVADAG